MTLPSDPKRLQMHVYIYIYIYDLIKVHKFYHSKLLEFGQAIVIDHNIYMKMCDKR
jgi:hypothetical protein